MSRAVDAAVRPAIVSPAWPPGSVANGIVTYVGCIRDGFLACGVEPIVISRGAIAEGIREAGVYDASHAPPAWAMRFWGALGRRQRSFEAALDRSMEHVARIGEDHGATLFECEESFGMPAMLRRHTRLPIVTRLHGPWQIHQTLRQRPKPAAYHRRRIELENLGLRASDGLTSPSADVAARMKPVTDAFGARIAVIPNPIRVPDAAGTSALAPVVTHEILFVGRFDAHKGGDLVLDALALLRRRGRAVRLIFCGPDRGVDLEAGERVSLPEYVARALGEEAGALDVRGALPAAAVAELRRVRRVTCVPSRYENFPYACLEAMASGCPVVAADIAGLAEIVRDGHDGLLHLPGDARSLADAIERLIGDAALADRLGQNAVATIRERYAVEKVARQTLDFYAEVARRSGAGSARGGERS